MDLVQLRSMGLMAANPLVKKTITIKYRPLIEGSETEREEKPVEATVDFWIRKFTAADRIALNVAEGEERAYIGIQRCVFTEDAKPLFPDLETARELDLEMFAQLLVAVNEINGSVTKKSQPRTNGGTRSPSPSAVGRSRSGSKPSAQKKPSSGPSTQANTAQ